MNTVASRAYARVACQDWTPGSGRRRTRAETPERPEARDRNLAEAFVSAELREAPVPDQRDRGGPAAGLTRAPREELRTASGDLVDPVTARAAIGGSDGLQYVLIRPQAQTSLTACR